MDEALYVHSGTNRATWIENMGNDSNVRLQADGAIYDLAASRVTSQDEFNRFSSASELDFPVLDSILTNSRSSERIGEIRFISVPIRARPGIKPMPA